MFGLVDGNNFFVSCERVFDPALEGRAVAVLSNNDGCCVSRSNEFKALGIPMGTPYFELKPLIRQYGLILRSSNYELYADMSRRMVSILHDFAAEVEQYSIDEAFIRLADGVGTNYAEYGRRLRKTILQWVGIPCGVGFAPSMTLAKIANHIGKKSPDGVFVMPDDIRPILEALPVSEVWGVGRRTAPKLERLGINSAWQLAQADERLLRRHFSVLMVRTAMELRGIPAKTALSEEDESPQSITYSRCFGHPVTEFNDLSESVCTYIARAAEKLRREGQKAQGVNLYFQYYPEYGERAAPGGFSSGTVMFERPTANTGRMLEQVTPRLQRLFLAGRRYKKSGIVFFGLQSAQCSQPGLFDDYERETRDERLSAAVDSINARFGRGTLQHLAEGLEKAWSMKSERLSPRYTTDWRQLPLAH